MLSARWTRCFRNVIPTCRPVATFKARYRSYVDRLGPAIVMNGLGQALATERAAAGAPPRKDDEKAHHELYVGLRNWLCREDGGVYPPDTDLLQEIMNHGLQCWTRPKRSVRTTRRLVSAPTVALGASRS